MRRIEDHPQVAGALCDIRSNLDDSPDQYSRHWAGMPAQRKLMHLRREGMGDDLRPWDKYSSDEKYLIRRSLKRVERTAYADAKAMGAIE
ncbi:MAG: hypothetical protein AB2758_20655 [Candidatus Thiodiazotropha endolucinida]